MPVFASARDLGPCAMMAGADATGWSHDGKPASVGQSMAQAATMAMGPPLSPREIRRSGRRSAPSTNSKSPDSDLPRHRDNPLRPPQAAPSRTKRVKDDHDDHPDDRKHSASAAHSSASNSSSAIPKTKRKNREKRRSSADIAPDNLHEPPDPSTTDPADEEEQGITRCVCGSNGLSSSTLIAPLTHLPPQVRTRPMLANSWFNVRPARSGNTAFAWATSQRIRSTTQTTTVSYVALSSTANSSSALLVPPSFPVFPLTHTHPSQTTGEKGAALVHRHLCHCHLTCISFPFSYPSPQAAFQEAKHHEQSRCQFR